MQTTVSDLVQILSQLNTGQPAPTAAPAANAGTPAAPAANAAAPAPAANAAAPAPAANAAPAAAPAVAPAGQAPFAAIFRCPSCDTLHFLGAVNVANGGVAPAAVAAAPGAAVAAAPGAAVAAAPGAGAAGPAPVNHNQAGPSTGRWYSVTHGRQIGVFQDWYGVVDPLVNGVPAWRCKSFSTYTAAADHFNAHFAAGLARVYTAPP